MSRGFGRLSKQLELTLMRCAHRFAQQILFHKGLSQIKNIAGPASIHFAGKPRIRTDHGQFMRSRNELASHSSTECRSTDHLGLMCASLRRQTVVLRLPGHQEASIRALDASGSERILQPGKLGEGRSRIDRNFRRSITVGTPGRQRSKLD